MTDLSHLKRTVHIAKTRCLLFKKHGNKKREDHIPENVRLIWGILLS